MTNAVQVKICGLARESDVHETAALLPDAMGFVFWPKSPRAVTPEQVGAWTEDLPDRINKVGVFVDPTQEFIDHAVETAGLDVVQLHGSESLAFCAAQKVRCWKALHLSDTESAHLFDVEALLVDSGDREQPGGTGQTIDWSKAAAFAASLEKPLWLAGGLSAVNVAEAIRVVQPFGVDVSSGVEARPAAKDMDKVRAFISAVRAASTSSSP